MAHALSRHAALRDPMELVMDKRDQSLEGTLVALAPFEQQCGDVGGVSRSVTILDPFPAIRVLISGSRF
jgi:hypothetical protein